MDSAVLLARRAGRWLQEALGVAIDGVIGPRSIAAAKAHANPHGLAGALIWRRMEAHAERVAAKPDQAVFITGWTRRCAALFAFVQVVNH
uniref:CAZy families GH108 protein n=1 Tax=uncultured Desulfarculus sp. TaxID=905005 RepID=A0A060BYQ5_9BACT|nr:CAZy families GH108 protein [uncultured Desulfarculus sp.]